MAKKTKLKNFIIYDDDIGRNAKWKTKTLDVMRKFFKHVERKCKIRHKINVIFIDQMTIRHEDAEVKKLLGTKSRKKLTMGLFHPPKSLHRMEKALDLNFGGGCCAITLPLRMVKIQDKWEAGMMSLWSIAMHEIGHYMQFRDKKKLTEDDIQQRTARIAKALWPKDVLIGFKWTPWYKYV